MTVNFCYSWEMLVYIHSYTTIAMIKENPKLSYFLSRIWGETLTFAIYRIQRQN